MICPEKTESPIFKAAERFVNLSSKSIEKKEFPDWSAPPIGQLGKINWKYYLDNLVKIAQHSDL
jgi:hypothetical protein